MYFPEKWSQSWQNWHSHLTFLAFINNTNARSALSGLSRYLIHIRVWKINIRFKCQFLFWRKFNVNILNSSTADIRAQRPSVIWDQIWLIFVWISSEDLITSLSAVTPTDGTVILSGCQPNAVCPCAITAVDSPFLRMFTWRNCPPAWNTCKLVNTLCCWSWIRDSWILSGKICLTLIFVKIETDTL